MFIPLLAGAGALVAGFLGYAATRPAQFTVRRSLRIKATPDKVFPHISDFHKWEAWSPWEKLDPAMRKTHSGPPAGRGAAYAWEGNNKVGKGRMEIVDATQPSRVEIRLEFERPWKATNQTEFILTPSGQDTEVTWSMTGNNNYMAKVFGVFMNMDKLVGRDFEKGLAGLKSVTEAGRGSPA
jgi:uncharacterized protein YndB with AHSA1/START domain